MVQKDVSSSLITWQIVFAIWFVVLPGLEIPIFEWSTFAFDEKNPGRTVSTYLLHASYVGLLEQLNENCWALSKMNFAS